MLHLTKKIKNLKLVRSMLAIVLAFAVLVTSLGITTILAADATNVWDGSVATTLSGSGTEIDPYTISNGAELAYAITSGGNGAYYKLTSDIYLNDVSKITWATGVVADGYTVNSWYSQNEDFSGTIDGDGYTVYGLYCDENPGAMDSYPNYGSGLIPKVSAGGSVAIYNLGVDNAYIEVECEASAFVGTAASNDVTIDKCYAGANVYLNGGDAAAFVGYCGADKTATITNSYSLATTNGIDNRGLVGTAYMTLLIVNNCYNSNGPIVSYNGSNYSTNIKVSSSYETVASATGTGDARYTFTDVAVLSTANMQGEDVFTNTAKMPNLNANNAFTAKASDYPILTIFDKPDDTASIEVWDGSVATTLSGSGTVAYPYLITNGAELAYAITSGGNGAYYLLKNDIYLNDITKINWTTGEVTDSDYTANGWYNAWDGRAAQFSGHIDGNGYVIYGLYHSESFTAYDPYPPYSVGLIPAVASGTEVTIKNLGLDNVYIKTPYDAGAFVGVVNRDNTTGSTVSFDSCYVGANAYLDGCNVAAFRAYSYSGTTTITNCYSLATLSANEGRAYGLVGGWSTLHISNSYNGNGPIMSDTETYNVTLTNCYQSAEGGNNNGVTTLTTANMQGEDVFTNTAKMPNLNTNNAFTATSGYPILTVFDKSEDDDDSGNGGSQSSGIWDGNISAPADADDDGVYEITTASELAYAVKNGGENKNYKLTADIYLNDITKINWSTGEVTDADYAVNSWYTSWSGLNAKFSGSIDGDGHTVYGLYYNEKTTDYDSFGKYAVGLIPAIATGANVSITNLGLDNVYIQTANGASAFVGVVGDDAGATVTIDQCYVGEKAYLDGYRATAFRSYAVGGTTTVTNSYSLAAITAHGGEYGLVGGWSYMNIYNCYNANGPIWSQALESEYYAVTIANCFESATVGVDDNAVLVSADNMKGTDVFDNDAKMPTLNADNVFVAQEGYPVLYVFTDGNAGGGAGEGTFAGWDGVTTTAPSKGKGTEASPYQISNAEELAYAVSTGGNGAYYKLTADIYLNDVEKIDWKTGKAEVGYKINKWYDYTHQFYGTIDGDGHVIHGLYYNSPLAESDFKWGTYGMGLIPAAKAGEGTVVKKLGIENSLIRFEHGASAFVGLADSKSNVSIDQCYAGDTVTVIGHDAGAFRGCSSGGNTTTIFNCYSLASVSAIGSGDLYSGLFGTVWGKIYVENSYNANGPIQSHPERYEVTFTNSYQSVVGGKAEADEAGVTTLSVNNMKGTDVFSNNAKMPALNKYGAYISTKSFPTLAVFSGGKGAEPLNDEGVKGRVWSGKLATKYAGGTGTESDPYIIETPEQLALLVTTGGGNSHYKVTADLKLNDTSKSNWKKTANQWYTGMTTFWGVFDGNGHVVSGLYYNNTENDAGTPAGLFQRLGSDSTIKRIGITDSYIVNTSNSAETFAAALVGWLYDWEPQNYPDLTAPVISECFVSDSVYIEGSSSGGFVGGCSTTVVIENCYFAGELTYSGYRGTFVGNHWCVQRYGPIIKNSYSASKDGDPIGGSTAFTQQYLDRGDTTIENVYNDGAATGCTGLSVLYMRGSEAKKYMKGFDFNKIWKTCSDGTPVLRCFENAEKYSCKREPQKVEISFESLGGTKCESIYGIPGYTKITEDMIPTPTRYGSVFKGWHHFNQYGADFELDVFPNFDIVLVAEWEDHGFTVGFENDMDATYDHNAGIEIFKPGVAGYSPNYIRSGWRSLHAKGDSEVAPMFLLSYENPLEVGKEYELSIWLNTDQDNASGVIEFIHSNYADVNDVYVGYQDAFEFSGHTAGEWKEYTVTFTANAPYIFLRSPQGCNLYFDDVYVIPTGNDGTLGNLKTDGATDTIISDNNQTGETNYILIIVIVVAAVVVVAGAVTAILLVAKKKKKQ